MRLGESSVLEDSVWGDGDLRWPMQLAMADDCPAGVADTVAGGNW